MAARKGQGSGAETPPERPTAAPADGEDRGISLGEGLRLALVPFSALASVAALVLVVLLATGVIGRPQVVERVVTKEVVKTVTVVATPTAAATATAAPTATQVATAIPVATVQAAPADAQVSPDGVYYLRIANPQARFEEANRYWLVQAHNGVDQTNVFVFDVPTGYVGVIQALEVDGQGGGWVKAYPSGVHTVRAKSVFAGITLEKWAEPLFNERVDLALTHNWARSHIEPLKWKAVG